jgi:hypothetical protein
MKSYTLPGMVMCIASLLRPDAIRRPINFQFSILNFQFSKGAAGIDEMTPVFQMMTPVRMATNPVRMEMKSIAGKRSPVRMEMEVIPMEMNFRLDRDGDHPDEDGSRYREDRNHLIFRFSGFAPEDKQRKHIN